VGQRHVSKDRLQRDRAQLLGALRDHGRGKTGHLSAPERAAFIESIERRLAALEEELREMEAAQS